MIVGKRQITVRPDAICAIGGAFKEGAPAGLPESFTMPFWWENDCGTTMMERVARQMVRYGLLASSQVWRERVPQLADAPASYAPPLLVVTTTWFRARRLAWETQAAAATRGITERPPIYLTIDRELMPKGLNAPVLDLWQVPAPDLEHESTETWIGALIKASRELIAAGELSAETRIRPNPGAAVGGNEPGWQEKRLNKAERERMESEAAAEIAALEARLASVRATQDRLRQGAEA